MKSFATAAVAVLLATSALCGFAQGAGRLIADIDISERDDHVDVSFQFGCGLQYRGAVGDTPTEVLRIRFAAAADCGDLSSLLTAFAPQADVARYVRALEWDRLTGTELSLTVRLAARQNYLLAPAADGRGLRLRLLRPRSVRGNVVVGDVGEPAATFAVNLDSSRTPFDEAAVLRAAAALGDVNVYVSTYQLATELEEETWYRLRAGPIATRSEAEALLRSARALYPRAWLAIGDETRLSDGVALPLTAAAVLPTVPGSAATMSGPERAQQLDLARKAVARRSYAEAIPLLTRLLEQPEYPERAAAQELMGLARERNGQLAHAKAEFEEYLRRYPDGPAVQRVRARLRALALATRAPGVSASAFGPDEDSWRVYGGFAQHYRRDSIHVDNDTASAGTVSQNMIYSSVDTVARRRGERFDFTARLDADYIKDLLRDGPGDRTRLGSLFVDIADRNQDWNTRLGRQTQSTGGLFGTFDGVAGAWQLRPRLRLKAATGYPVELASEAPDTERRFVAVAGEFGTFRQAWDLSVYGLAQQLRHQTERQVVGTELRYFQPDRTLVALVDYDLHFSALNNTFVLGTLRLPGRWTVSSTFDRRKSPSLSLRNAIIGQPTDSFDTLAGIFTPQELHRLARNRSADSTLVNFSAARPFGEQWQWSLDLARYWLGATPASGGVPATPASGADTAITLQGMAFAVFGGGDMSTIALRHQAGSSQDMDSIGLSTRLPVWGKLRLGPSLRIDRRQLHVDDTQQWQYTPGLRLELLSPRYSVELESGAEFARRQLQDARESSRRFYFSLGYRMNF